MKLDPHWVAGFTDGEGCFYVGINPHRDMTAGYQVLPEFRIVQHEKDIALLRAIARFFKAGVVRKNHDTRFEVRIRSFSHLKNIIIPFFETYPLHTHKKFDFLLFKKIILAMDKEEHLKKDGIANIFRLAEKMNRKDKTHTKISYG